MSAERTSHKRRISVLRSERRIRHSYVSAERGVQMPKRFRRKHTYLPALVTGAEQRCYPRALATAAGSPATLRRGMPAPGSANNLLAGIIDKALDAGINLVVGDAPLRRGRGTWPDDNRAAERP
jgi:hypothetical protein